MQRRAFSLVELLVAIAIFSVLAALTASTVQKVRERSRRIDCQNRFRQCALGLQQFHDQNHAYPQGFSFPISSDNPPTEALTGWQYRILPYIEQSPLFQQCQEDYRATYAATLQVARHRAASTIVTAFACPSDPRTQRVQNVKIPFIDDPFPAAMGSIVGVCGTTCDDKNGTLYTESRVRISMISDGAAHTLLLGERPASHHLRVGWWYCRAGFVDLVTGDLVLGVRELAPTNEDYLDCGPGPYMFQPRVFADRCAHHQFWSPHASGANFAFADGSVRFLNYSAAPILAALSTRAGGESVDIP